MGLFDDFRRLRQASNHAAEAAGRPTTTTGRIANIGNDIRAAADQAAWVAAQSAPHSDSLEGGLGGTAVLRGHQASGAMAGFEPISDLDLEVTLPGCEPYRITARVVVPYQHLARMTYGRELRVRVDPADRGHVAIDW